MKKITYLLVTGILVLMVTGCQNTEKDSQKKTDSESAAAVSGTTQEVVQAEEEYENNINIDDITNSIKINDQTIGFPIEVTKLKQSIVLGNLESLDDHGHFYRTYLKENDSDLALVYLYSESGKPEEDGKIYFLEVRDFSNWKLELKGLTFGASIDDATASLGEAPYASGEKDGDYRMYYENCDYEYVALSFENNQLRTISFENMPQEWRSIQ